MDENLKENFDSFLSLAEASKLTGYHQDYLGFLCRTGKLQGFKIGRNWTTTKQALDEFIKNYKNGVSEIVDETGRKIPVKVERLAPQVVIADLPAGQPPIAAGLVFSQGATPQPQEVLPAALNSSLELRHLRRDVIDEIDKKVQNLSASVEKIETQTQEQAKQLEANKQQILAVVPVAETAPQVPSTAAAINNFAEEDEYVKKERQRFSNKFASNFDFGTADIHPTTPRLRRASAEPERGTYADQSKFALGKEKVKQLYGSFTKKSRIDFNRVGAYALVAIILALFMGSVFWRNLFNNLSGNQRPQEMKIVYQNNNSGKQPAVSNQQPGAGQGGTTIVNKTVNQLLGFSDADLYSLIDNRLNQYLAEGRFKGPKGDQGLPGLPGGATYVASNPATGFSGGSIGGTTYLSSQDFATNNITVNISLTDNGTAVFNGYATFNGNTNLSGTTTIANLNVANINPNFTQGSVVFQGLNGLAQDNANFYWDSVNHRLGIGTTTPEFALDVNGVVNAQALYVNGTPYIGSQWISTSTGIYFASGNVGIGTTSASSTMLTVAGDTSVFGNLAVAGTSSLASAIVGNLTVTGTSTLDRTYTIELAVSDLSTLATTSVTSLAVSGISSLATTTISNLTLTQPLSLSSGGLGFDSSAIQKGGLLAGTGNGSFGIQPVGSDGLCLLASSTAPSGMAWTDCAVAANAITSLNGLTNPVQTFATGSDINIGLNITSSGSTHTFTPTFTGTLAANRLNSNVVQGITNDTNITGSILNQVLTLGWNGQLSAARGGTGTNTLASLTVGSNLNISGGQNVLIGTSTQITLSNNPSFTSITATASSSLGNATATAFSATTFNGNTLTAGSGTLTLNNNTLSLQGGNTTLVGINSITSSTIATSTVGTSTISGFLALNSTTTNSNISGSTVNNVTIQGNSNTLTLLGTSSIDQSVTTTSTPTFAGLTVNGPASAQSLMVTGNLTATGSTTLAALTAGTLAVTGSTTLTVLNTTGAVTFASPTTIINTVTYLWPSIQGAANTFLMDNGSGTLSWSAASTTLSGYAWMLGGNTLTATGTFGTLSNNDLNIITNSTTRMTILSGGNVGIGSSAPASLLDVFGTAQLRGASNQIGLYVNSSGNVGVGTTSPVALFSVSGNEFIAGSSTITNLNQALPVRSTAGGALFNGAVALGSSDVTGILPILNGGTGASTLAGANIVTANASAGQVPYFTAPTTQAGSANFLWNNTSNLLTVNGTINATTSNFTNLNASSTVLTNATTTGQSVLLGQTNGKLLALDQNGIIISTSTAYQTALSNPDTGTGASPQIAYWSSATGLTGASGFLWDNSNTRMVVNGTINASSTNFTNATTSQLFVTGSTNGKLAALDANGMLIGTSTAYQVAGSYLTTIGSGSSSTIPYFTATANTLQGSNNLSFNGSNLVLNGTIYATSSNFTNATTSQLFVTGQTGKLAALDANGMLIATSTSYQTALTNPDTGTGASPQIAYWSSATGLTGASGFLWDNSNTRMVVNGTINATSSNFTNLNASSTVLTNSTTTNQSVFSAITGPTFLALDSNHILMATSTPVLTVTGSGSLTSTGGTSPNIALVTLANNAVLFGQGSATIGTSTNFSWLNGQNLFSVNGTINATSSLFTNATSSNLAATSLTSALPVRSTTAGYLYNGAINLSSGSSDITGTLAIGSGGTGATTLAGANIVTANASAGQVPLLYRPDHPSRQCQLPLEQYFQPVNHQRHHQRQHLQLYQPERLLHGFDQRDNDRPAVHSGAD